MGSSSFPKVWTALFFASWRRQASANQYRYKDNIPRIRNAVLRQFNNELSKTNLNRTMVQCDRTLFDSPLETMQDILIHDINAPSNACLKMERTGFAKVQKAKTPPVISSWQNLAPIFIHPLDPLYDEEKQNGIKVKNAHVPFEFKQTIRLFSKDTKRELSRVCWPDAIFSYSCNGIGVSSETYKELMDEEGTGDSKPQFMNVSNDAPLKIFEVDFVPKDCDAIGLFPAFEVSHRALFTGLDLCVALIRCGLCEGEPKAKVERMVTTRRQQQETDVHEIENDKTSADSSHQNDIQTLKELVDKSKDYQILWSRKRFKDKTCPGDIIRSTLATNDVTITQMKEEYFKHYVLFNIFSQALRLYHKVKKENMIPKNISNARYEWQPCDLYIWQKFLEINSLENPSTVQEMIDHKKKLDEFLIKLNSYYFSVLCEMKSANLAFFETNNATPRIFAILKIFRDILLDCKAIKQYYPNLSYYAHEKLRNLPNFKDVPPEVERQDPKVQMGKRILAIIQHSIEFEHLLFADRFSTTELIQIEPLAPIENWKLVILTKDSFPPEVERLLKFNTRIYTQFVNDLDAVTRKSFSYCKSRKMIDENTFLFLYQLGKPEKFSREQLVTNILEKLEDTVNEEKQPS